MTWIATCARPCSGRGIRELQKEVLGLVVDHQVQVLGLCEVFDIGEQTLASPASRIKVSGAGFPRELGKKASS